MIKRNGTTVLVSGATGRLGREVYLALAESPNYDVLPFTFGRNLGVRQISDQLVVEVLDEPELANRLADIKGSNDPELVVVDCTSRPQWQTASLFAYSLGFPTVILGREGNCDQVNKQELRSLLQKSGQFDCPYEVLLVPNACLPIAGQLEALEAIAGKDCFLGLELDIAESLPSSDGAALEIARDFRTALEEAGSDVNVDIFTEQRPEVQRREWGVPEAYLDKHAIYKIHLHGPGVSHRLEIRVMGYQSHALGLRDVILPEFIDDYLGNRRYGMRIY